MGNTHDTEIARIEADYIKTKYRSQGDYRWGYTGDRGIYTANRLRKINNSIDLNDGRDDETICPLPGLPCAVNRFQHTATDYKIFEKLFGGPLSRRQSFALLPVSLLQFYPEFYMQLMTTLVNMLAFGFVIT